MKYGSRCNVDETSGGIVYRAARKISGWGGDQPREGSSNAGDETASRGREKRIEPGAGPRLLLSVMAHRSSGDGTLRLVEAQSSTSTASTLHDGCLDGFEFRRERQAAEGVTILSDAVREK